MSLDRVKLILNEKIIKEIKVFFLRNRILLYFPNLRTKKNRVNLNYYHAEFPKGVTNARDSGLRNLGDTLSPHIVEYLLGKKGLSPDQATQKTHHLYALGSIMLMGYQDATVWGSGILSIRPSCAPSSTEPPSAGWISAACAAPSRETPWWSWGTIVLRFMVIPAV